MHVDERYKKLARTIKVLMQNKPDPPCPNVSSINGDHFDTSMTRMSPSSQFGSEVVAWSSNMRGIHRQKYQFDNNTNPSNTNSPSSPAAKILMPPPRCMGILAHSSRRNSLASSGNPRVNARISSPAHSYTTAEVTDEGRSLKGEMVFVDSPDRIFSKWRVLLNDKGELLIKGTLECGKVARSKPVKKRLSIISVQSIFNHVYNLLGNIYDERSELPEYVRGKFYNGFPDDWENVHQLWVNYIAGGCNPNFRWPTPITDDDDDIKSEMTEATTLVKKNLRVRSNHNVILPKPCVEALSKSLPEKIPDKQSNSNLSLKQNSIGSETIKCSAERTKSLNIETSCTAINGYVDEMQKHLNNSIPSTSTTSRSKVALWNVFREDYLQHLLDILANENCSVEHINKFRQLYDICTYFSALKLTNDMDAESQMSTVVSNNNSSQVDQIVKINVDSKENEVENKTPSLRPTDQAHKSPPINSVSLSNTSYSSKRMNGVRRKLSNHDYATSNFSESNSEDDERSKTKKHLLSRQRRSHARRNEQGHPERLNVRRSIRSDKIEESEDEFGDKKIKTPSILTYSQPSGVKIPSPVQKSPLQSHTAGAGHMENSARARRRQESYDRDRRRSPSTIRGFLATYDSSVSITEDECKSHDKTKPSNHPKTLKINSPSINRNQQYDSSVSITEDESVNNNPRLRQQKVLQEANARCLNQLMARKSAVMNNKKQKISQDYYRKLHEAGEELNKIQQLQQELLTEKNTELKYSNNKENRSNDDDNKTTHVLSRTKSRESDLTETKKTTLIPLSPVKNVKPVITKVENVAIDLKNHLSCKHPSTSKTIDDSINNNKKIQAVNETGENALADSPQTIKNKVNAIEKGKKLTVQLEKAEIQLNMEKGNFGSETNPKRLSTWLPKVVAKNETTNGLIFEGKLLNEAGHIVNRKFVTDFVLKRISPTIFETESHNFYELFGDLCDTKHKIPKEIIKLCSNKCPLRIQQFCEKWKKLIKDESDITSTTCEETLNVSMDIESMPTSSRGRRIVPPLCYWAGERVTMKDNQPVYNPGNLQLSLDSSRREQSASFSQPRDTSVNEKTISTSTKNSSKSADKASSIVKINTNENNNNILPEIPAKETQKGIKTRNSKRRLTKIVSESSSDDKSPPMKLKKKPSIDNNILRKDDEAKRPTKSRKSNKNPKILMEYNQVPYHDDMTGDESSIM